MDSWWGRNPGGSNAKRGMSIKGERIGEQRTGRDILERGNFAGEKNKRSVASSELRAWGKASALWFFEEESDSISVLEVIICIHGSYLVEILSESRRSGGSGEGPQIGDSTGDRTQNLWFHKRIKLELELGLLIKIDLGSRAWIRIGDRLVRGSDSPSQLEQIPNHRDMDPQYATVDQLAEITDTMASLRDAILGLGQRIDGHQAQPLPIPGSTLHDSTIPPPPPPSGPSGPTIQQDYIVPPPHHHRFSQLPRLEHLCCWDGYDDMSVAALPAEFRMPDIERYTRIGCPRIHLQLYNTVMRGHRLDKAQMIMLFPLSLNGAAQRWFASWTLRDRPFRQGPDETVTSFISRWREKIAQIIDRPSERDQISMIMCSLQPCFARHLMGFPQIDFGSLVQALYALRRVYLEVYGQILPFQTQRGRSRDQAPGPQMLMIQHGQYRPVAPIRPVGPTYLHPPPQPGLVDLGCPGVATDPLPTHDTRAVPPPPEGEYRPPHREVQIVTRSGRIAQPPLVDRPFAGIAAREEVQREDDEILRQLCTTQACISIWSLLASSSTHRDALVRAVGQIRVDTATTP
ncbi:hypothetical protein CK203_056916 [Vitis vinifera]|uniref:Retrotransposon gag domain-containing protein n=1 Tax=Vitis vinifera TaxID=29760 RepID=A0A438FUK4_VITVI|nr:hypothetical protein CK203_056916 [Vitis vinifera]